MEKIDSGQARLRWRELLDSAMVRGGEVVIERYSNPIAVLVNVDRYKRLLELERIAEYRRQFAEIEAGAGVDLDSLTKEPA